MPRIRVALIGLSQSAKTSWASEAHLPYLLSDRGLERYEIVALLNSSEQAARNSIAHYSLGPQVRAYGSPQDLALDKDIDLVVCTTRVDVHYNTIRPSIEAGKDVFVEWPLAENCGRANELAELAREKNVRTMVGLQARVAPATVKAKELVYSGVIGKVLSSHVQASTPFGGGYSMSEGLAYFLDKRIGGNPITIAYGHMIDFVHHVLGEYKSFDSQTQIQRPQQTIHSQSESIRNVVSDVPDLLSVHGVLQSSEHVVDGATLTAQFRSGPPFPGTLPFIWTIQGDKGEIRITSERGPFIQSEASGFPIPIEIHRSGSNQIEQVEWKFEDWQLALPVRGKNIAKLYDLFHSGVHGHSKILGICDFDNAVLRHNELDSMLY